MQAIVYSGLGAAWQCRDAQAPEAEKVVDATPAAMEVVEPLYQPGARVPLTYRN
jgi:streptomycin 6-kinase